MSRKSTNKEPSDHERLRAVRDRLEAVLASPDTTPRDLATVSREYRLTLDRLAAETPSTGTSPLDEVTARRRARGAS